MTVISNYEVVLLICAASLGIMFNWLLIKTIKWHGKWSCDASDGVQKIHSGMVPRIGGVSILIVLVLSVIFIFKVSLFSIFLLVILPAFIAGFAEDLTKAISPLYRLMACLLVGVFAWMNGLQVQSVDINIIDALLKYPAISLLATMLTVAALANAVNMIDGLNGLASGYCILVSIILTAISMLHQDYELASIGISITAAVIGFILFNWPFGRLFLGDGGAYMLGALIALLAIAMAQRVDQVTLVFTLVILSYPAWEISLSMIRRLISKSSVTQPDSNHLHSRMHRYFKSTRAFENEKLLNSFSSLLLIVTIALTTLLPLLYMSVGPKPPGTNFMIIVMQFSFYSLLYYFLGKRL